jgi:hypothetical protein
MGSMNTIDGGASMPPGDVLWRYNLIPGDSGLRVRLGSREWVTGLDGEVRSIFGFTGSSVFGGRLFAATRTGIWNVTSSTAAPTRVVTFGTQGSTSGYCIAAQVSIASGSNPHVLLVADEANGLYRYEESGGTWTKYVQGGGVGEIANVDPATIAHVTAWKHRVWLTERGSGRAWYLPTNAIAGAAAAWHIGAHFQQGGELRGLWSWTYDGGAGVDDALVAVSGGGDVVVYLGTDPATVGAFVNKGRWNVGGVPAGRTICSAFGGDLLVMSSSGIVPMSRLFLGKPNPDTEQYSTRKIANWFNRKVLAGSSLRGWSMALHPLDGTLLVLCPAVAGGDVDVLAMALTNQAWSQYTDLDMAGAACTYDGALYYGTTDGRVLISDGYVDGITLADPNTSTAIPWAMLTAFSDLGEPGRKQLRQVRTTFRFDGSAPLYAIEARYRWNADDVAATPFSSAGAATGSMWDSAIWDESKFEGDYGASQEIRGLVGSGPEAALAIRGTSTCRTVLVRFDVTLHTGGFL